MKYVYKQLRKEICGEKVFLILLLLLSVFTSYMYFFVRFSTDGNLVLLGGLEELTENQILYQNALNSNVILAQNIFAGFLALTGFVYAMFYCRFFNSRKKQFGTLRALGFTDGALYRFFVGVSMKISLAGALLGLFGAYGTADLLIRAGEESYQVTETVKKISVSALGTGFLVPMAVMCLITRCAYLVIEGKEMAFLISGIRQNTRSSKLLGSAQKISGLFPAKHQLSVRLVLRKPLTVLLLFASVLTLGIMFILAYSLNLSSEKVYRTQVQGRQYEYEIKYDTNVILTNQEEIQSLTETREDGAETQGFLETEGILQTGKYELEQTITGMEAGKGLYVLEDAEGNALPHPSAGQVLINPALQEVYGLNTGDSIELILDKDSKGERSVCRAVVSGVAHNGDLKHVYVDQDWLAEQMGLPTGSRSGAFGTGELPAENLAESRLEFQNKNDTNVTGTPYTVVTAAEREEALRRESVSNRTSAVINQVLGVLIGSILLYLAMLLNFQDSTRDIVILHLMGYQTGEIRKLLVDIYKPALVILFLLAVCPAVLAVKGILRSLSMQIGDYMPFCTNGGVFAVILALVFLIYGLVQLTFGSGIHRILEREDVENYIG